MYIYIYICICTYIYICIYNQQYDDLLRSVTTSWSIPELLLSWRFPVGGLW